MIEIDRSRLSVEQLFVEDILIPRLQKKRMKRTPIDVFQLITEYVQTKRPMRDIYLENLLVTLYNKLHADETLRSATEEDLHILSTAWVLVRDMLAVYSPAKTTIEPARHAQNKPL